MSSGNRSGDEVEKLINDENELEIVDGATGNRLSMSDGTPVVTNSDVKARSLVADDDDDDDEQAENAATAARKVSKKWATDPSTTMFWASSPTADSLPAALYKCFHTPETGYALKRLIVSTDDLIAMDEDAPTTKVRHEIYKFWARKDKYDRMGLLHKRGIIMYGDPGSGKTATIQQLVDNLIQDGGIAIYADDPNVLTGCLQLLRRIEPVRPVIVILEDFETLTERSSRENEWLSVLDGEAQISNVVFLATTNYIEKLDKRFTDRPSRFDTVMRVPMPTAKTRAIYLTSKLGFCSNDTIAGIVKKTSGMSIAHLKEIVVAVFCLNDGIDMADEPRNELIDRVVSKLRDMQKRKFSSDDTKPEHEQDGSMGFKPKTKKTDDGSDLDYEEVRKLANQYLVRLNKSQDKNRSVSVPAEDNSAQVPAEPASTPKAGKVRKASNRSRKR